jgi:thiamine-phosphate pyrophosphorylase
VKLHALVDDVETARRSLAGGATVLQLRIKGARTEDVVSRGRPYAAMAREAGALFVVNDDVEAAILLAADGVHLGREDEGAEDAVAAGLLLGLSAAGVEEARGAESAGAGYVGAGPVWATPSKPDADPPIGLDGLRAICHEVDLPVVAIGGVDAGNAADCIRAGAAGVAVVRAAADARAVITAVDEALAAR